MRRFLFLLSIVPPPSGAAAAASSLPPSAPPSSAPLAAEPAAAAAASAAADAAPAASPAASRDEQLAAELDELAAAPEQLRSLQRSRDYIVFEVEEKLVIARYARENGPRKAESAFPGLAYGTACNLRNQLIDACKQAESETPIVNIRGLNGAPVSNDDRLRRVERRAEHLALQKWEAMWAAPSRAEKQLPWSVAAERATVQAIVALRSSGRTVSRTTARALLTRYVREHDAAALQQLGGTISNSGVYRFLRRNSFSSRRTTSKLPLSSLHADAALQVQSHFWCRIARLIGEYSIPQSLVANFDQAGLILFNTPRTTFEKRGSKRVFAASASSDKAQITVLLTSTAAGLLLAPQVWIVCVVAVYFLLTRCSCR